jgi:hypothetical protein
MPDVECWTRVVPSFVRIGSVRDARALLSDVGMVVEWCIPEDDSVQAHQCPPVSWAARGFAHTSFRTLSPMRPGHALLDAVR